MVVDVRAKKENSDDDDADGKSLGGLRIPGALDGVLNFGASLVPVSLRQPHTDDTEPILDLVATR